MAQKCAKYVCHSLTAWIVTPHWGRNINLGEIFLHKKIKIRKRVLAKSWINKIKNKSVTTNMTQIWLCFFGKNLEHDLDIV